MKSSLTTLLQLSKGAIHLSTSVAAKGPDHIFFILSQHLYDMQLEMLLACKYANPTKAELQTQGLDGKPARSGSAACRPRLRRQS